MIRSPVSSPCSSKPSEYDLSVYMQSTGQPSSLGAPHAPVSLFDNLSVNIVINSRFNGIMLHNISLSSYIMDSNARLALSGGPLFENGPWQSSDFFNVCIISVDSMFKWHN